MECDRQRGPGIVWLASYPKSGNTWMRLFFTALERVPDLTTMAGTPRGGSARSVLQRALDISLDGLAPDEIDSLRPIAYRHLASRISGSPLVLKVHDLYRCTPAGVPLFPPDATAGCLHLIRDPRDVCLSLAAHSAVTVDRAIAIMADPAYAPRVSSSTRIEDKSPEVWGSWSEHTRSWLASPGHRLILRYEDLLATPLACFTAAARFCGFDVTAEAVTEAVRRTDFGCLAAQELELGFVERPAAVSRFFRAGRAGQWRETLSAAQVARIERDHGRVMNQLGYCD